MASGQQPNQNAVNSGVKVQVDAALRNLEEIFLNPPGETTERRPADGQNSRRGAKYDGKRPLAGSSSAGASAPNPVVAASVPGNKKLSKSKKQKIRNKAKREAERKEANLKGRGEKPDVTSKAMPNPGAYRKQSQQGNRCEETVGGTFAPPAAAAADEFAAAVDASAAAVDEPISATGSGSCGVPPRPKTGSKHGNRNNRQRRAAFAVARSAQAPVHTEPSKRQRLDDTVSPRGEYKKVRLDTGRPAPASYADIVQNKLCVAITRADDQPIIEEQANRIKKFLSTMILAATRDPSADFYPSFRGKPIIAEGVLKLWCEDERSRRWLCETISGLPAETCPKLVVKSQSDLTRRVRAALWLPECDNTLEDTKWVLHCQNQWANVQSWSVLSHSLQRDGTMYLMLGIPESMVPTLLRKERRLSHNLGSVYVRFYGTDGALHDVPPGKEQPSVPGAQPGPSGQQKSTPAESSTPMDARREPPTAPAHSSPKPSTSVAGEPMSEDPIHPIGAWREVVELEELEELLQTGEESLHGGDPPRADDL